MTKDTNHLRELFQTKLHQQKTTDKFHKADLNRIEDNDYLNKFILHNNGDIKAAFEMLWDTLVWRKQHKVNDITEDNINMDYINEGVFYPYGRDNDGCLVFIFQGKKYTRGSKNMEQFKNCLIYWFERLSQQESDSKITFVYNAEGTGLQNSDVVVIKFLVSLIRYYPNAINHLIGYEVPWVMNAMFNLIKQILPPALVKKMKLVNKVEIHSLISPDQLQTSMSGFSDYTFSFVPIGKSKLQTARSVYFDQIQSLISVNPASVVEFRNIEGKIQAVIHITNNSDSLIAFKIRTTAPEKFCVEPCIGIIGLNSTSSVHIFLQDGVDISQVLLSKFLIACLKVPKFDISVVINKELWNRDLNEIDEFKLKCSFPIKQLESPRKVSYAGVYQELNSVNKQVVKLKFFMYFFAVVNSLLLYVIYDKLCKGSERYD